VGVSQQLQNRPGAHRKAQNTSQHEERNLSHTEGIYFVSPCNLAESAVDEAFRPGRTGRGRNCCREEYAEHWSYLHAPLRRKPSELQASVTINAWLRMCAALDRPACWAQHGLRVANTQGWGPASHQAAPHSLEMSASLARVSFLISRADASRAVASCVMAQGEGVGQQARRRACSAPTVATLELSKIHKQSLYVALCSLRCNHTGTRPLSFISRSLRLLAIEIAHTCELLSSVRLQRPGLIWWHRIRHCYY
jgi:hypothetical protein